MTEAPAPPFNWIGFIGGLFIALVCGGFANIFLGAVAMGLLNAFFGFLLCITAGALLIIFGLLSRRSTPGFAAGLLCGGCIIGLIGGICGANMVGTTFH
ncbi:MAG TPA: hypothetical protein VGJ82_03635 [Thermoanaerobaculia bacterium]|jgi:hypothetical protein